MFYPRAGAKGQSKWEEKISAVGKQHSPVHGLLDLLLPQFNQLWGLHACRHWWETSWGDQPTAKHKVTSNAWWVFPSEPVFMNASRCFCHLVLDWSFLIWALTMIYTITCLLVWRIQFHLVSPRRSPPPPLLLMTPHLTAQVLPTVCGQPPPRQLWPDGSKKTFNINSLDMTLQLLEDQHITVTYRSIFLSMLLSFILLLKNYKKVDGLKL